MLNTVLKLFQPKAVDSILSKLNKALESLDKCALQHAQKCDKLKEKSDKLLLDADNAAKEANRADRIAAKVRELVQ